jgi:hypothetical protein
LAWSASWLQFAATTIDEKLPRARLGLLLQHFAALEDEREPRQVMYPLKDALQLDSGGRATLTAIRRTSFPRKHLGLQRSRVRLFFSEAPGSATGSLGSERRHGLAPCAIMQLAK